MTDRTALYPGRVQLVPVQGQPNIYDMVMADQPSVAGTPLNKANLLTDATAQKFVTAGLASSAPSTPNVAFDLLASWAAYESKVTFTNVYTATYGTYQTELSDKLSEARYHGTGATVGNYALIAGGEKASGSSIGYSAVVDAYNTSLTRSTPTALSVGRISPRSATVGNYALIAGGSISGGSSAVVDAYNTSLTRSTPTALGVAKGNGIGGASVGNYALFAGGASYSDATVYAYNASLTRSAPTELSVARASLVGSQNASYVLFAGGKTASSTYSKVVNAYNSSLTMSTPADLGTARANSTGTTVGAYAIIAGGSGSSSAGADALDAYNASLTRSAKTMSASYNEPGSASIGTRALIAGSSTTTTVDVYNSSLSRTAATSLQGGSYAHYPSGAAVGNSGYVLFGGVKFTNTSVLSNYAVAYDCKDTYDLNITIPRYVTYFISGQTSSEVTSEAETVLAYHGRSKYSGYIKYHSTLSGLIAAT